VSQTHNHKYSATCEERENQQDATIICLLSISLSTCFGHHYAHLQENKDRVTAYGVLRWFCWMWLIAVVGRCVVGFEHWFCWMWLVAVVGRCVVGRKHCPIHAKFPVLSFDLSTGIILK
jgi:hypothetical protein